MHSKLRKTTPRRPVNRDILQKKSPLDMSNDCCPSDECGSVMIWGGTQIFHSRMTELVTVNGRLNARQYCDEIIIPVVIPVLQRGKVDILQQNNAHCHVINHTMLSPFTAEQDLDT